MNALMVACTRVLNEIMATIKARQRERIGSRLFHFLEHHDVIAELKRKVDDSVDLLKVVPLTLFHAYAKGRTPLHS